MRGRFLSFLFAATLLPVTLPASDEGCDIRNVPRVVAVGDVADPVVVHVEAEGGRRCELRQPAGLARDLDQIHAEAAELPGQRHLQVAGVTELVEVFLKEAIVPVVARRPLAASVQQGVGQD